MDKQSSSRTSASRDGAKSKHQSKDKKAAKKAKKQQDAYLAGVGAQFQQDSHTTQASGSTDYPETLDLD